MSKPVKIHFATHYNNIKELLQNPGLIREDADLQDRVRQAKTLNDELVTDLLEFCGLNGSIASSVLHWLNHNQRNWDALQRTIDTYHANRLARQVIRLAPKPPTMDFPEKFVAEATPASAPRVAANKSLAGPPSMAVRQKALRELYSGSIDDLAMLLSRAFAGTSHKPKIDTLMLNHLRGYDPADDVSALVKATGSHVQQAWFAEHLTGTNPLHDIALGLAIYLEGLKEDRFAEGYTIQFTKDSIENVRRLAAELLPRLSAVIEGKPLPVSEAIIDEVILTAANTDMTPVLQHFDVPTSEVIPDEPQTVLPFIDPALMHDMRLSLVVRLAMDHPINLAKSVAVHHTGQAILFPKPQAMGELIQLTRPVPRLPVTMRQVSHRLTPGAHNFIHTARGFMGPRRMIPARA